MYKKLVQNITAVAVKDNKKCFYKYILHHLDKSPGPDRIQSRALKELAEVLPKPLPIISQPSWPARKVPLGWMLENAIPM